jgi:hypothetical protein
MYRVIVDDERFERLVLAAKKSDNVDTSPEEMQAEVDAAVGQGEYEQSESAEATFTDANDEQPLF